MQQEKLFGLVIIAEKKKAVENWFSSLYFQMARYSLKTVYKHST